MHVIIKFSLLIIGPSLPFQPKMGNDAGRTSMITSPSGTGVILICKMIGHDMGSILELTGNSKETLKWTVLDQKVNPSDYYLALPYI